MDGQNTGKLDVKALAVAFGLSVAAYMLFLGWAAMYGWGDQIVSVISSLYIGFAPSFVGGIIGAVWGFVDGAIGGAIIALIYNWMKK